MEKEFKALENLRNLIGENVTYLDGYEDIVCCFDYTEEEIIVEDTNIYSNFDGYGQCKRVNAYENRIDSEIYELYVSEDGILVDVNVVVM